MIKIFDFHASSFTHYGYPSEKLFLVIGIVVLYDDVMNESWWVGDNVL